MQIGKEEARDMPAFLACLEAKSTIEELHSNS